MARVKTHLNRRSFIKSSALAGGGLVLGFNWLAACRAAEGEDGEAALELPDEWFELNGFISIGDNGRVTIMSPNPEIGQNVKTSMPMIVAEELDCDWRQVIVEQAPLNTAVFTRQVAGGSQSIRQGWPTLRTAGATARHMLREAAAEAWGVPAAEITTALGVLTHAPSGKTDHYGAFASAAVDVPVPEEVDLKDAADFKIVGTSRRNVDLDAIVTGKPLYGIDTRREGMRYATIVHAPAFGMRLASFDAAEALAMPGVSDVFRIDTYADDYEAQWSDVTAFPDLIAVVGDSTYEVLRAAEAVSAEWEIDEARDTRLEIFETEGGTRTHAPLESTADHGDRMAEMADVAGEEVRRDGDPEAAFAAAAQVVEASYTAPFLAHNTLEPMNFFADVTDERAELVGPIQTPEFMEKSVAARLGLPLEAIDIHMTRMGGGFGRRLYGHFLVEAAVISQQVGAPVQLVYSREADLTFGCYRPAYHVHYRAALDADGELTALHVRAGGIPESPLFANRFPAGAVDNYLAQSWTLDTNVSVGAWRAPRSNFIAGAEQAFLDEVAEAAGKDPIDFRLELLERAAADPVGEENDYDAERYAGVLRELRARAGEPTAGQARGISAYYCHNSYVANALDLRMAGAKPVVERVHAVVDCGIVVNPDAARNMVEGGTVDGIGHALYSQLTLVDGVPEQRNLDRYRLIRNEEAPKAIDVHFINTAVDPTGLGEPPFPPIIGALANALYRATGKRVYDQPFVREVEGVLG